MLDDLQSLLDDHQLGMSDFQDDYFVTLKTGTTLYGQYKQALRELYTRTKSLKNILCENELLQIDIEEIRFQLDEMKECSENNFAKRRKNVELKRKIMHKEESDRSLRDTAREWSRFYQQAQSLKAEIGNITPERRRRLEMEMWEIRVKEKAAADFLTLGRLQKDTIELMNSLPLQSRRNIQNYVLRKDNHQELMDWYLYRDDNHVTDFDELPLKDIKNLIHSINLDMLE